MGGEEEGSFEPGFEETHHERLVPAFHNLPLLLIQSLTVTGPEGQDVAQPLARVEEPNSAGLR